MNKTKAIQLTYIILEFIAGLTLGTISGYLVSRENLISGDIGDVWLITFLIIYLFEMVGVYIVGHFYLKQIDQPGNIGRTIRFISIGTLLGFIVYIILDVLLFGSIPYYLTVYVLPIALPLIGAVMGFNFKILKRNKLTEKQFRQ